jgi:hypothetical protein
MEPRHAIEILFSREPRQRRLAGVGARRGLPHRGEHLAGDNAVADIGRDRLNLAGGTEAERRLALEGHKSASANFAAGPRRRDVENFNSYRRRLVLRCNRSFAAAGSHKKSATSRHNQSS